jgi:hypothetical protein
VGKGGQELYLEVTMYHISFINMLNSQNIVVFSFFFFSFLFFFLKSKDLSISLIKDYKHKDFTLQGIKFCKIIATFYEVTKS